MIYTTYVLYSPNFSRHYKGFTSDLAERMISHNQLGKDWTARFRPWKLIYTKEFSDKKLALAHEKWLKSGAGRDFIKTLHHQRGFISAAADGSSSLLSGTKRFHKRDLFSFMIYTTYVLYSPNFSRHYKGFTSDLAERMISHNQLGKDWTARFRPWKLIYTKEFSDKKLALAHEKWLKSGAGRDFIKTLHHQRGFISAAADGSSSLLSGTKRFHKRNLFSFMIYTTYVLYSPNFSRHYKGFTSDLAERMISHNQLGKDWTARFRPWKLIYTKEFSDKKLALAHEKWLKSGAGRDFIKTLHHQRGFISAAADGSSSLLSGTKRFHKRDLFSFMIYTTYVLYSPNFSRHYKGFTSDLAERMISHNQLGKDWTARFRPWKLIYTKDFSDKKLALAHEKWLKSGAGRDFIKTLHHQRGFISAAADGSSSLLSGTKRFHKRNLFSFMIYTTYVLYSPNFSRHYKGFTSDLAERMISHNQLGKDWTARFRPWKLIYTKEFSDKKLALAHEKWLKSGAGRDFIRTVPH